MTNSNIEILECGPGGTVGERSVAIILNRERLLYDIANNCYTEGHIMVESHDEVRHTVQDVAEEGNVDRVARVLDMAHADIVERLYPFTQREIDNPVVDDRLRDKPVYGIFLNVPETFSQTTLNLLGHLIHEFMACNATADWLSITNPPKEEVWRRKVDDVLRRISQVRSLRSGRSGRVRIRPHWP